MIKRFLAPVVLTAALAAAAPAFAIDWRFVDQDDEAIGVMDADAIDRSGANPKVDLVLVFREPTDGYRVMALKLEFDCKGQRYQPLTVTLFDDDLKAAVTEPTGMPWKALEPNSRFRFMSTHVCDGEQMRKAPQDTLEAIRDAYLDGKVTT